MNRLGNQVDRQRHVLEQKRIRGALEIRFEPGRQLALPCYAAPVQDLAQNGREGVQSWLGPKRFGKDPVPALFLQNRPHHRMDLRQLRVGVIHGESSTSLWKIVATSTRPVGRQRPGTLPVRKLVESTSLRLTCLLNPSNRR